MRHPEKEVGDKRVCPITGERFVYCWTDNLAEPWEPFGECDSCKPGRTLAEDLHRLNEQAKRAAKKKRKTP